MTEPRTEAGRELLGALTVLGLRSPETDNSTGQRLILRIEAEATAAAEQRIDGLREAIEELPGMNGRHDAIGGALEVERAAVLALLDPAPREARPPTPPKPGPDREYA